MYDVTNPQSKQRINEWREAFITTANPQNPESFPFLILGNKIDLDNSPIVRACVVCVSCVCVQVVLACAYVYVACARVCLSVRVYV